MRIGNREFDTNGNTYIMGILNVTPDSFSDGGKWNEFDAAMAHVKVMVEEGASIIDVGGESTRPGYTRISDEDEIARVVPVIRAIKEKYDVAVSVDTYKSKVAKAAIEAGADLVNDIWGFKADPDMAKVVAEAKVACCLMHNREEANYENFMEDMLSDLRESIAIAKEAGIADEFIMTDPGVGFGKSYENNLEAIAKVDRLHELGYPVLLAVSRKSVIGLTLDVPASERVVGTAMISGYAVEKGCQFVRVHDIKENRHAIEMMQALKKWER